MATLDAFAKSTRVDATEWLVEASSTRRSRRYAARPSTAARSGSSRSSGYEQFMGWRAVEQAGA